MANLTLQAKITGSIYLLGGLVVATSGLSAYGLYESNPVWAYIVSAAGLFGLYMASFQGRAISREVRAAFDKVIDVSLQIQSGDLMSIEVDHTGDEVEEVLIAMKGMVDSLDEKNQQMNSSIIELLSSVAQLSKKDLTGKAAVNEDVTGPVADAINMMVQETCSVLGQITRISGQVEKTANTVKSQADKVTDVASNERLLVVATADELNNAAMGMSKLAKSAHAVDGQAGKAIEHTRSALEAVEGTTHGIESIRTIIRETEKRIKRLGERSQEITSVVNIINGIAERTHILALNASMHAAAAGEAGRGFGTVAEEVKRLAEGSRESTAEISTMVNNIRAETVDAVNTMSDVITKVAEGTNLAAVAAERMKETEAATAKLVSAVQIISKHAMNQANKMSELSKRTQKIVLSTEITDKELKEQVQHTDSLVQFAHLMRKSVATFKLPAVPQN